MARLNIKFALLVAFLVVFIGHGLVTDAKPIEKKESEEKAEATTEVAPKEDASDDAADDEEDAPSEDASTKSNTPKSAAHAHGRCKNKNCGKRAFGPLRPFSHRPAHQAEHHEDEGEEGEGEEGEEDEEKGEEDEEKGENAEDRGYDDDAQRNVMAQDGGPSEDLEGAFSHAPSGSKGTKRPKDTSNIKEGDDEERIEQDIINSESEPEQRDSDTKPEETLQNPQPANAAPETPTTAVGEPNEKEVADNAALANAPAPDALGSIDPAVAAAAAAKTATAAAAAEAGATPGASTQTEEPVAKAEAETPSADVHDDGEMREINEGNYDHHCSDCPFEHEQIMQVSHGHHKGFLHGHGTFGNGCGCGHGTGCGCGCDLTHGALGPSGTCIGCDCKPAGHLATYVSDTKNTPACPNMNTANICGNVNLGLPHPCCQQSNAQDANALEAQKTYCPSSPPAAEAKENSTTVAASGEEPTETTDAKIQKFKDSVSKASAESKGESTEGETKHPEKRSDNDDEVIEEVVDIVGSRLTMP